MKLSLFLCPPYFTITHLRTLLYPPLATIWSASRFSPRKFLSLCHIKLHIQTRFPLSLLCNHIEEIPPDICFRKLDVANNRFDYSKTNRRITNHDPATSIPPRPHPSFIALWRSIYCICIWCRKSEYSFWHAPVESTFRLGGRNVWLCTSDNAIYERRVFACIKGCWKWKGVTFNFRSKRKRKERITDQGKFEFQNGYYIFILFCIQSARIIYAKGWTSVFIYKYKQIQILSTNWNRYK